MSGLLISEESVKRALNRPSPYGVDVDIGSYRGGLPNLEREITSSDRERMEGVGTTGDKSQRSGSFIQYDQRIMEALSRIEGLEVMSIKDARDKGLVEGLEWNLVSPDKDKYTAAAYLNDTNGQFIRVTGKVEQPFQSCLFMGTEDEVQYVHNIILMEPGSSMEMITGCTTGKDVKKGLHIGITEIYVGEEADLSYTMLHEWGENLMVRPRTAVRVERGGNYTSNYISLHKVKSVQMYPKVELEGEDATTQLNSIVLAPRESELDIGGAVDLKGVNSKAEIISRTVSSGGKSIARGQLIGKAEGIAAHLECNGIMLNEGGLIHAVPELASEKVDVDMSHEASVGRIAKDQVEYLMSRGLSEEEATTVIIRGFLAPTTKGLPERIKNQIDRILESREGL